MQNALALGTFDGLHTAHIKVLEKTVGYNRIAVTFSAPPKSSFGSVGLIMTTEQKLSCLKELGIHQTLVLDFGQVKNMSAEDFLEYLYKQFNPALISCGFNYRFGKGALGNTELLRRFCDEKGIKLCVCESVMEGEQTLSSTLLRSFITNGDIKKANSLIYGGFCISSPIISGDKRGRTIDFPTANQMLPKELAVPKFGVYASKIEIDGRLYKAITNIGIRPTYLSKAPLCETYILGFSGDAYGKISNLYPLEFLREEKKFSSLQELRAAIKSDVEKINM